MGESDFEIPELTIETIKEGAALEMVNLKLDEAIENIADINTDPLIKREVVLKIILAPSKNNRYFVDVTVKVEGKMGSQTAQSTAIEIKRTSTGAPYGIEFGRQMQLPFNAGAKVTPIKQKGDK